WTSRSSPDLAHFTSDPRSEGPDRFAGRALPRVRPETAAPNIRWIKSDGRHTVRDMHADHSTARQHRARWAAIGAAVAVSVGAGGFGIVKATSPDGASA